MKQFITIKGFTDLKIHYHFTLRKVTMVCDMIVLTVVQPPNMLKATCSSPTCSYHTVKIFHLKNN